MEDASQQSLDGFASAPPAGERAADLHNLAEQPLSPKNERIVSANPSPDTAVSWAPGNTKVLGATSETSAALSTMYPFGAYTLPEQGFYYGGYDNGTGNWDEHSNYANVNNLQVMPPAMYNDNQPLFFPTGYGFDSQMAYGQFSPLPSPLSPIMFDGQLYSPHQMPVSSPYYPPPPVSPGLPHVTSAFPASQTELMPSEISGHENPVDNAVFGPGSGFYMPFGAFGGGDISGNSGVGLYKFPGDFGSSESLPNHSSSFDTGKFMSPMAAGTVYPQSIGILGPYEQNAAQTSFQGYGLTPNSSARRYPNASSYQRGLTPNRNQLSTGRGGRRDKERDSVSVSTDTLGITDRNRGPRFSKAISKSVSGEGTSSAVHRNVESISGIDISQFNIPDFTTDYENAKFFVIKSFSEDNVHRSIKYNVWASTSLGNRKLDAAYREAKESNGICPVLLFFSVNASGQFCGVAEMVGPVDFDNDANYWQQDRWSGQFPVKWHIIKDVPNTSLRHILLQNNENKPVTHSRDSQEVKLEQGIEMLKIFKNYDAESSLLEDFDYYDEREKSLQERKVKQPAVSTGNPAAALATAADSINQLSDNLADALRLDSGNTPPKTEF